MINSNSAQTSQTNLIDFVGYEKDNANLGVPKGTETGAERAALNTGDAYGSLVNKLHMIKLANGFPLNESDYRAKRQEFFVPKTAYDLCRMNGNHKLEYDIEDFMYCKHFGQPINRLITLRRFPYPCTDNIFSNNNQMEPDIARMVTYFNQEVNRLEDVLGFSYAMKWKELNAEMEQASAIGDQSGFEGLSKKIMSFIDPILSGNKLQGQNKLNYDPKHDQNKVYGPVDSITQTHIRDVGLEFNKEFDITFEYDLQSWGGRGPEGAFKDILANVLATTYNNAKFWPGSRYWVGERPSQFVQRMQFMNPETIDQFFAGGFRELKSTIQQFATKGSAIQALKNAMTNGMAMALGKLLDNVGRPSILVMNSLLSGEPTGFWHLTIGNPDNPIMCIGNLLCTGVDVKFPTDSLSYGDFPTKMQVNVKLKPGQPKDKAGIEMMFNHGKQRLYYNPKKVKRENNHTNVSRTARTFYNFGNQSNGSLDINRTLEQTFDFVADKVEVVTTAVVNASQQVLDNNKQEISSATNKGIDLVNRFSVFQ